MKEQIRTGEETNQWKGLRNIVITGPDFVRYLTPDYEVIVRKGETSCRRGDCLTEDAFGRKKPEYEFSKSIHYWLAGICAPNISPGTNLIDIGKRGESAQCTVEVNTSCPIPDLDTILTTHRQNYERRSETE